MTGAIPVRDQARARGRLALAAATAVCAAIACPAAAATSLDLTSDALDLAVRTTAASPATVWAPTLGGQVDLKARLPGLQTSVLLGLEAGSKADPAWEAWLPAGDARSGRWSARRIWVGAVWAPTP